ncbi:ATP-dependent helicase [Nocardia vinacea]|uniref:ATP-dependent helicase n=1 Tax=Nocardia vinacea TaxID=96468 RepID=UPI0012F6230D|nr:ATP-dependent helicase [Nocardia vinacea]
MCGWYAFLMRHWVRPFLPLKYPGRQLSGLNFDGSPPKNARGIVVVSGVDRFLDSNSRAYKMFLSKLAVDIADAAEGSVIARLERIYDEIYIDEVQDLVGYDLDIVESLLKSTSVIHLVGDLRQSLISTNPNDPRLPEYRGLRMRGWFEEQAELGHLRIENSSDTWRSVQAIATFSDSIFDSAEKFPPTISKQTATSDHEGVFAISEDHVREYIDTFNPVCLRERVSTPMPDGVVAVNFGLAKGLTHDRVLIFPTGSIKKFLYKGDPLKERSACGLYVGVTRAIHSVAFVLDRPEKASLRIWTPSDQLALKISIPQDFQESLSCAGHDQLALAILPDGG